MNGLRSFATQKRKNAVASVSVAKGQMRVFTSATVSAAVCGLFAREWEVMAQYLSFATSCLFHRQDLGLWSTQVATYVLPVQGMIGGLPDTRHTFLLVWSTRAA